MVAATAGTWIRYAAVLCFQALFAWSFGSSAEASFFIVALSLVVALSWIAESTVRTIAVPRVTGQGKGVPKSVVSMLWRVNLAVILFVAAVLVFSPLLSAPLPRVANGLDGSSVVLVQLLFVWALIHFWAGQLAAFGLAKGRRFWPSVAPSIPFLAGACFLLASSDASVSGVALVLCIGAAAEVCLSLIVVVRSAYGSLATTISTEHGLSMVAALTAGQLALLALMGPVERVMAELVAVGGGFHYDYAFRSLMAVYQLVLGGIVLVALADWAVLLRDQSGPSIRILVNRIAMAVAGMCLCFTVIGALAPSLVQVVYERGSFTAEDTAVVSEIMIIAAPGFAALSASILLTQVLVADQRNATAVWLGALRFVSHVTLAGLFSFWGVKGIALGVTVAEVLTVLCAIQLTRPLLMTGAAERKTAIKLAPFLIVSFLMAGLTFFLDLSGIIVAFVALVSYVALFALAGASSWVREDLVNIGFGRGGNQVSARRALS
jgi:putative peptidoglycan lipid II flippase